MSSDRPNPYLLIRVGNLALALAACCRELLEYRRRRAEARASVSHVILPPPPERSS